MFGKVFGKKGDRLAGFPGRREGFEHAALRACAEMTRAHPTQCVRVNRDSNSCHQSEGCSENQRNLCHLQRARENEGGNSANS